jgi:hypothetical protein
MIFSCWNHAYLACGGYIESHSPLLALMIGFGAGWAVWLALDLLRSISPWR